MAAVSRSHPTSIRLSPLLKAELKREADKRQWGLSHLIVEVLKTFVKRRKGQEL